MRAYPQDQQYTTEHRAAPQQIGGAPVGANLDILTRLLCMRVACAADEEGCNFLMMTTDQLQGKLLDLR